MLADKPDIEEECQLTDLILRKNVNDPVLVCRIEDLVGIVLNIG
jgi:hypothetical protein